jgi:hypothetical protein
MTTVTISENFIESHPALVDSLDDLPRQIDDQFPGVTIESSQATGLQSPMALS